MSHIVKLIELEGQIFDELMLHGNLEASLGVIKRQLDLLENHIAHKRKQRIKPPDQDINIDDTAV